MKILKKLAAVLLTVSILAVPLAAAWAAPNFDDDGNRTEEELPEGAQDPNQSHPEHELDNPENAYTEDLEYKEYIRLKTAYNETVAKLTALGIWYGEIEGEHTDYISEGELCALVCGLMNMQQTDAYNTIRALYPHINMGGENEPAAFIEGVKILVNALGYGVFAADRGGDDNAYLAVWSQYKLAPFSAAPSDKLTLLDAAQLMDGILETEVYEKTYKGNNAQYQSSAREAIDYFKDIKYTKGIVRSAGEYSLDNSFTGAHIRIDNQYFAAGETDYLKRLGYRVKAYYKSEDMSLVYLAPTGENKTADIEGRDIYKYTNSRISYGDDKSISIDPNAVEVLNYMTSKSFDFADLEKCDYITAVDNNDDNRYDVIFVFKYDIMVVNRAAINENKLFGSFNGEENYTLEVDFNSADTQLFDRNENPVESYYITADSVLSVASCGKKTRIIISNLAYSAKVESFSGEGYKTGRVKFADRSYRMSTNGDNIKMSAGKKYTVYLDYMRRIAAAREEMPDEIKYGYLIRAVDGFEEYGEDCVLMRILPYVGELDDFKSAKRVMVDGTSCSSPAQILYALETAAYECHEAKKAVDPNYNYPNLYDGTVLYVREPILYKTNDAGEITYIDTPKEAEAENGGADLFKRKTMTYYPDFSKTDGAKAGGTFLRNLMAFSNNYGSAVAVDNGTKVFVVPVTNDISRIRNRDNYIKSNLAYFKDWRGYPETGDQYTEPNRIDAYNLNEERVAGVIVYSKSVDVSETLDKTVPLTVVSKIEKAMDSDGRQVTRLWGFQGNSEIWADLAEGVYLTKAYNGPEGKQVTTTVKTGDIIRYVTNSRGEIADWVKVFSLRDEDDPEYIKVGNEFGSGADPSALNNTLLAVSDGKYSANGHNTPHIYDSKGSYNFGASYRVVYATLAYKNGANLVLRTMIDTAYGQIQSTEIADFMGFNVLCIDEAADRVYVPTQDELISEAGAGDDASRIIMHTEGGKQRELIIVKRAK